MNRMNMGHISSGRNGYNKLRYNRNNNKQIQIKEEEKKEEKEEIIVCSVCNENLIEKVRFQCTSCENYNVCEECIDIIQNETDENKVIHPLDHLFLRIPSRIISK